MLSKEEKDLLYHNNQERKSFQWELWSLCNQRCTFCYLGEFHNPEQCTEEKQLSSLQEFNQSLDNLDFTKYNNVSLIGGEFFQGEIRSEKVKKAFMDTCIRIGKLYKDKKIGSFWMTVTLTRAKQDGLYELLNYYEDHRMFIPEPEYGASGLWLCTSWDPVGRFHTLLQQQTWDDHMRNLTDNYPWVKKNTTIILTEPFLEMINDGSWTYKEFSHKHDTTVYFKPAGAPQEFISGDELMTPEEIEERNHFPEGTEDMYTVKPEWFLTHNHREKAIVNERLGIKMFPRRQVAVNAFRKIYQTDKEWFDKMINIRYRADEFHRNFKPEMHDDLKPRNKDARNQDPTLPFYKVLPCGHNYDYAVYVDSPDKCMLCDKLMIEESED